MRMYILQTQAQLITTSRISTIIKYAISNIQQIIKYSLIYSQTQTISATMLSQLVDNPLTSLFNSIFNHSDLLTDLGAYLGSLFVGNNHLTDVKVNANGDVVDIGVSKGYANASNFLFLLGLAAVTYGFVKAVKGLWGMKWVLQHYSRNRQYHRAQKDSCQHKAQQKEKEGHGDETFADKFKRKYGDCYVLITGAADGIGLAYAREFAKMGFNLIMVDIQGRKLMFRRSQILQSCSGIKIQFIVCDMSDLKQIEELLRKVEKFDVGILINNVGLTCGGKFLQLDPVQMRRCLSVNYIPMYTLTKHLIPYFRARKNRSAIINMSSVTGLYPSPYVGPYSSIKCAIDIFSRSIALENSQKIDVITARPFGVSTGMMKMQRKQGIITPKQCAVSILADLGHTDATFSGLTHKFMGSYFGSKPQEQVMDIYSKAWEKNKNTK